MVKNKIRKKRFILSKILINQMIYRHKYTFFPDRKNYFVIFANETIKHTMLEQINLNYEKVVLVGIINQMQDEEKSKEYLDELEFLTYTAGGEVLQRFTQKLDVPNPKTFIGTGKMEEVQQFVEENGVGTVIFDDELSPAQQKNIERILKAKILDRTGLILDIFAQRAQTSYSRTQVELAQYQYLLPRLTGLWTHLERQRGGIGMRGPGETEIETDRRIVRDRIALLKKKLATIDRQMAVQRGNRGAMVRVALIGYTNVGKSTLMNVISKSEVFAENKLFATLDTTVRKVVIGNLPFLLSDTVGFIRKLPTQLIESFKSTLDEVREADLLLHIVDISHPNFEEHIHSVNQILSEIKSADKPTIMVFNKIDAYKHQTIAEDDLITEPTSKHFTLEQWKQTWMNKVGNDVLFISALNKDNLEEFREKVYAKVREIHITRFPYNNFLYPEFIEDNTETEN
ncbi:GTPase HflX [Capnocytophaga canimorsus]|nr:GTPase HflX [Capnocytophaga canimorsus]